MTKRYVHGKLSMDILRRKDDIMCGRYTIFTEEEIIEMRAIIQEVSQKFGDDAVATGEIFPTNTVPVLTLNNNRLAPRPVSWGFPK